MRYLTVIPTLAALLLLGAGCAAAPSSAPEAAKPTPQDLVGPANEEEPPTVVSIEEGNISMDENGFSPATLTIGKGTLVGFNNTGSNPHWPA